MAVTTCYPCSSLYDLQVAAGKYANAHALPQGTHIIIFSQNKQMAAHFPVYINAKGNRITPAIYTSTDLQAVQLDDLILSREKGEHPLKSPHQYYSLESTISIDIENQLKYIDNAGYVPFYFLPFLPSVVHYDYLDMSMPAMFPNGYPIQIFVGEIWTVQYPGGFEEKWQYEGAPTPSRSTRWTRVPGTLMLNGKPYSQPSPTGPGYPINASTGERSNLIPGDNGSLSFRLENNMCWGTGTVTITAPDGSSMQGSGVYSWQC